MPDEKTIKAASEQNHKYSARLKPEWRLRGVLAMRVLRRHSTAMASHMLTKKTLMVMVYSPR